LGQDRRNIPFLKRNNRKFII